MTAKCIITYNVKCPSCEQGYTIQGELKRFFTCHTKTCAVVLYDKNQRIILKMEKD